MLSACERCEGFLPGGVERCPNCASPAGKLVRAAAAAGLMMTLMACYGGGWDGDGSSTCPALTLFGNSSVSGTTAGCPDFDTSTCLDFATPEATVNYVPSATDAGQAGTLTLSWTALAGQTAGVYVRDGSGSELACQRSIAGSSVSIEVSSLEPLEVLVEGTQGAATSFQLSASFTSRSCGDGTVGGSELCDDGNRSDGDGCSSSCGLELCAGAPLVDVGTVSGDTRYGRELHSTPACASGGPEIVYQYLPPGYGTLQLALGSLTNLTAYVTSVCSADPNVPASADTSGVAACATPGESGGTKTLSVPVSPAPVWIVVDGATPTDEGFFDLALAFTPASDECPDAVPLPLGLSSDTSEGGSFASNGFDCAGPERFYAFTAPSDGTLTIIVDAEHDASLKLSSACSATELAQDCVNQQLAGDPEALSFYFAAGETRYLAIEGVTALDAGSFELSASFTPE